MITAETVNGIVRFQVNGCRWVSLHCRVDPGASQREVRVRVDSLLDQIRPLAKDRALDHRYGCRCVRISSASRTHWGPGTVAVFGSALIEAAEEQEALIDQLEARREELSRRLGQPVRTNGS